MKNKQTCLTCKYGISPKEILITQDDTILAVCNNTYFLDGLYPIRNSKVFPHSRDWFNDCTQWTKK